MSLKTVLDDAEFCSKMLDSFNEYVASIRELEITYAECEEGKLSFTKAKQAYINFSQKKALIAGRVARLNEVSQTYRSPINTGGLYVEPAEHHKRAKANWLMSSSTEDGFNYSFHRLVGAIALAKTQAEHDEQCAKTKAVYDAQWNVKAKKMLVSVGSWMDKTGVAKVLVLVVIIASFLAVLKRLGYDLEAIKAIISVAK